MIPGELRIGNWYNSVKFNTPVQCTLSDLYDLGANSEGAYSHPPINQMFEPIPLTEEWLEKNPYDQEAFKLVKTGQDNWAVEMCWTGIDKDDEWRVVQIIDYVHEWQNLYFALTGEELTIN